MTYLEPNLNPHNDQQQKASNELISCYDLMSGDSFDYKDFPPFFYKYSCGFHKINEEKVDYFQIFQILSARGDNTGIKTLYCLNPFN